MKSAVKTPSRLAFTYGETSLFLWRSVSDERRHSSHAMMKRRLAALEA